MLRARIGRSNVHILCQKRKQSVRSLLESELVQYSYFRTTVIWPECAKGIYGMSLYSGIPKY